MHNHRGTDGERYTDSQIWEKLETDEWAVCCWDTDTGVQVIETEHDELLFLRPAEPATPPVKKATED